MQLFITTAVKTSNPKYIASCQDLHSSVAFSSTAHIMTMFVGNKYGMNISASANSSVGNKINYYPTYTIPSRPIYNTAMNQALPKGYHLDVVGGPSTPHDPESDAGGSLSSWQSHPSR
jgi:hypothetical protein